MCYGQILCKKFIHLYNRFYNFFSIDVLYVKKKAKIYFSKLRSSK